MSDGEPHCVRALLLAGGGVGILSRRRIGLQVGLAASVVVLLAGMAAFALVRYQFKLRGVLMSMIIAGMMFPVFSTIIPVLRMLQSWGILNQRELWKSMLATILPLVAAGCPRPLPPQATP